MDRRIFLASAFASPLLAGAQADGAEGQDSPKKGVLVAAGRDRTEEPLKLGSDRVDGKANGNDTPSNGTGNFWPLARHMSAGRGFRWKPSCLVPMDQAQRLSPV